MFDWPSYPIFRKIVKSGSDMTSISIAKIYLDYLIFNNEKYIITKNYKTVSSSCRLNPVDLVLFLCQLYERWNLTSLILIQRFLISNIIRQVLLSQLHCHLRGGFVFTALRYLAQLLRRPPLRRASEAFRRRPQLLGFGIGSDGPRWMSKAGRAGRWGSRGGRWLRCQRLPSGPLRPSARGGAPCCSSSSRAGSNQSIRG